MKTNLFIALGAAVVLLSSCGAARQQAYNPYQAGGNSLGVKEALSEEQIYAEDPNATTFRAWGRYNGFEDENLESIAAMEARAKIATQISSWVKSGIKRYSEAYSKNALNGGEVQRKKSNDATNKSEVEEVTEQLLRGARIVKSSRYIQNDGTRTCFVVVELSPEMAMATMKSDVEFQEAISEAEQMKIDFKSKQFEESMKASFEEFRAANKR